MRERSTKILPPGFSVVHGAAFGIAHLLFFAMRWGYTPVTWWLTAATAAIFFIPEIHGAVSGRENYIDTWSQIVVAFLNGGPSRYLPVTGWLYLMLGAFSELPIAGPTLPAPDFVFACSVIGWLTIHFFFKLRHG